MTRQIFLYASQKAFYLSLISLLKNWPGKIEIEEEFIHLIKSNCVPGNSVCSMTMEMEIQFKLSQLLPLTPADHVSLKSLPIFLGDKVIGLKFFSSLMLRSIIIFPLTLSKKWWLPCNIEHNLYATKLLLFHVSYFNIPSSSVMFSATAQEGSAQTQMHSPSPTPHNIPLAVSPEHLMVYKNCSNSKTWDQRTYLCWYRFINCLHLFMACLNRTVTCLSAFVSPASFESPKPSRIHLCLLIRCCCADSLCNISYSSFLSSSSIS